MNVLLNAENSLDLEKVTKLNFMTEQLRKEFKKEFCSQDPDFEWALKDLGSIVDGEEIADWWLQKLTEQRININFEESIKRYNQAKEDGTLDKHFPKIL